MGRMRLRFSGLCLFHVDDGEVVAWVLDAKHHTPGLWFDPKTATSFEFKGGGAADAKNVTECFVIEKEDGKLGYEERAVDKVKLQKGEVLSFAGGTGGPPFLPGAVSLGSVHDGLQGMNYSQPRAAVVRLNRGRFVKVPKRTVIWHNLPGGTNPPREVRLWTDLIVDGLGSYTLESRNQGADQSKDPVWSLNIKLDPAQEARLWILNDFKGTPPPGGRKATHFVDHFDCTYGKAYKPYPELEEDWPCKSSRSGEIIPMGAAGGSMFCPDGQYP